MAVDDDTSAALRAAQEAAKTAQDSDDLETIHEHGGLARTALEGIPRGGLPPETRNVIEEAILHAVNAQRAVSPDGGRYDSRIVRELIDRVVVS